MKTREIKFWISAYGFWCQFREELNRLHFACTTSVTKVLAFVGRSSPAPESTPNGVAWSPVCAAEPERREFDTEPFWTRWIDCCDQDTARCVQTGTEECRDCGQYLSASLEFGDLCEACKCENRPYTSLRVLESKVFDGGIEGMRQ